MDASDGATAAAAGRTYGEMVKECWKGSADRRGLWLCRRCMRVCFGNEEDASIPPRAEGVQIISGVARIYRVRGETALRLRPISRSYGTYNEQRMRNPRRE